MATRTAGNVISPQERVSMARAAYSEADSARRAITKRTTSDILDMRGAISAFNQRIAQMNLQAVSQSVFMQQQLLNNRAAYIQQAQQAYEQHYAQYGSTLNESALKFLDSHAKIDVPTFTSIMAGYEHAKASAEQRDRERIDAQVAMAEKQGALDEKRAALIEKEVQARLEAMTQPLRDEIAMLTDQIKMRETEAKEDRDFQLRRADAIMRAFGSGGSAGSGGATAGLGDGTPFYRGGKSGETVSLTPEQIDARIAELEKIEGAMLPFVENPQALIDYDAKERRVNGLELIEGLDEDELLKGIEKRNPELYKEYMTQLETIAEKKAKPLKEENKSGELSTELKSSLAMSFPAIAVQAQLDDISSKSRTSIPKNITMALGKRALALTWLTEGEQGVWKMTHGDNGKKLGNGNRIFNSEKVQTNLALMKVRMPDAFKSYKVGEKAPEVSDEDIKKNMNGLDWEANADYMKLAPYLFASITGVKDPTKTTPKEHAAIATQYLEAMKGKEVPSVSPSQFIRSLTGLPTEDANWIAGTRTLAEINEARNTNIQRIQEEKNNLNQMKNNIRQTGQTLTPNQQKAANAIHSAIGKTGLDPNMFETMMRMSAAESAFDPTVKNGSGSSALGLFQITDKTWKGLRTNYGQQYGLTEGGRINPEEAAIGTALLIKEHLNQYGKNGIEVTPGNIYLGHFFGTDRAVRFIKAAQNNPNETIYNFLTRDNADKSVFDLNTGVFLDGGRVRTLGEIVNWANTKMGMNVSGQQQQQQQQQQSNLQIQNNVDSFGFPQSGTTDPFGFPLM